MLGVEAAILKPWGNKSVCPLATTGQHSKNGRVDAWRRTNKRPWWNCWVKPTDTYHQNSEVNKKHPYNLSLWQWNFLQPKAPYLHEISKNQYFIGITYWIPYNKSVKPFPSRMSRAQDLVNPRTQNTRSWPGHKWTQIATAFTAKKQLFFCPELG